MDYKTKIIVDANKATRDLQTFEKALHGSDATVRKLKESLIKIKKAHVELNAAQKASGTSQKELNAQRAQLIRRYETFIIKQKVLIDNQKQEVRIQKQLSDALKVAARERKKISDAKERDAAATQRGLNSLSREHAMLSKVAAAEKKLAAARRLGYISKKESTAILEKYINTLRLAEVRAKKFAAAQAKASQATSLFGQALLFQSKLFHAAMLALSVKTVFDVGIALERTAEKLDLLNKKITYFSGDAKSFDLIKLKALEVGVAIDDLGRIMTRFQITTKGAFSTKEMLKWTDALVRSARATGTTTQEMNNALIQLSQSFSAGFLMGDEYRSISENLPMYKIALEEAAKAQGKFTGSLKEMSSSRLIDVDLMTSAFTQLAKNVEGVEGTINTIDAAVDRFDASWSIFVASILHTDFTKTSLNWLAAFFTQLTGDRAQIIQMTEQFPKLAASAQQASDAIKEFGTILSWMIGLLEQMSFGVDVAKESLLDVAKTLPIVNQLMLVGALKQFAAGWIEADEKMKQSKLTIFETENGLKDLFQTIKDADFSGFGIEQSGEAIERMHESANRMAKSIALINSQKELYQAENQDILGTEEYNKQLDIFNSLIVKMQQGIITIGANIVALGKNQDDLKEKLAFASEDLENFVNNIDRVPLEKPLEKYIKTLEELEKKTKASNEASQDQAEVAEQVRKGTEAALKVLKKEQAELAKKTKTQKKITADQKIALKAMKELAKATGPYKKAIKDLEKIKGKLDKTTGKLIISNEDYAKAMELYKSKTKEAVEAAKELEAIEERRIALHGQFHPLETQYIQDIQDITDALKAQIITQEQANEMLTEKARILEDTKACETLKKEKSCLDDMAEKYDSVQGAVSDYSQTQKELNLLVKKGRISQEQANKELAKAEKVLIEAKAAAGDFAAQVQVAFDEFGREAGENFTTYLSDAFNGTEDAFENFTDRMRQMFFDMLADMAYQALVKPIMVNVMATVGNVLGGTGASSSLTSSLTGGSGGNNLLGNVAKLFSSSSGSTAGMFSSTTNTLSNALGFGNIASPATKFGTMYGTSGQAISNTGLSFGGSNLAISGAGILGGIGADMLYDGKGYSGIGGGVGSSLGYSLGTGAAAAAAPGTMMASLGMAAGPLGAVAGMIIGGALGSLIGGSDSDVTPDLNLQYNNNASRDASNPEGQIIHNMGAEENGTFDPAAEYRGRFASFAFGTQHDAFSSEEQAREFIDSIQGKYAALENMVYEGFGKQVSEKVVEVMDNISSGEIKFEDFSGGSDFTAMFNNIFSEVFEAIGEVAGEEYDKVFESFLASTGSLEVAVASAVSVKDLVDNTSLRPIEDFGIILNAFVKEAGTAEEQMLELVATTQLLKMEDASDEVRTFLQAVWELHHQGNFDLTAQRILGLVQGLTIVNTIFTNTGNAAYEFTMQSAELAESLIQIAGGMEAFVAKTSYYYDNFFTDQEKARNVVRDTSVAISAFNEKWGSSVLSKSSLRKTITALGEVTEEEQEYYNALLELAPAVVALDEAKTTLKGTTEGATDAVDAFSDEMLNLKQTLEDLVAKLNKETDLENAVRRMNGFSESLSGLSTDLPKTTAAYSEYISQLGTSNTNLLEHKDSLVGYGQALLDVEAIQEQMATSLNDLFYALKGDTDLNQTIRQIQEVYDEYGFSGSYAAASATDLAKYVQGLKTTDVNLRKTLPNLQKLGDGLIKLREITKNLNDTIDSAFEALYGKTGQIDILQERLDQEIAISDAAQQAYESDLERYQTAIEANAKINDFLDDLSISELNNQSPLERLNATQGLFNEAVSSGDTDKATKYAQEYLQQAQQYYASSANYSDIYSDVTSKLDSMIVAIGSAPVDPTESLIAQSLQVQIDTLNRQAEIEQQQLERQDHSNTLLQGMLDLAIATDSDVVAIAEDKGVDFQKLNQDLNKGDYALYNELITYAAENQLTTFKLAEITGVGNTAIIKYLKDLGTTDEQILYYNAEIWKFNKEANDLTRTGSDSLDLNAIAVAIENGWSTNTLADAMNISNIEIEKYLLRNGVTQEQIKAWNAATATEGKASNQLLTSADTSLQSIDAKTFSGQELAEDLGYGGIFTDNQMLQIIGEYTVHNYDVLKSIELFSSRIFEETNRTANNLKALNDNAGIPSFAVGTDFVEKDQAAFIHKGEMIIDANTASQLRNYGISTSSTMSNEEILAELRALRAEIRMTNAINAEGFTKSVEQQNRQANAQEEANDIERLK